MTKNQSDITTSTSPQTHNTTSPQTNITTLYKFLHYKYFYAIVIIITLVIILAIGIPVGYYLYDIYKTPTRKTTSYRYYNITPKTKPQLLCIKYKYPLVWTKPAKYYDKNTYIKYIDRTNAPTYGSIIVWTPFIGNTTTIISTIEAPTINFESINNDIYGWRLEWAQSVPTTTPNFNTTGNIKLYIKTKECDLTLTTISNFKYDLFNFHMIYFTIKDNVISLYIDNAVVPYTLVDNINTASTISNINSYFTSNGNLITFFKSYKLTAFFLGYMQPFNKSNNFSRLTNIEIFNDSLDTNTITQYYNKSNCTINNNCS